MTQVPGPYRRWVLAARPRTLPTVMVPVAVGASLVRPASIEWVNSLLCVAVGLALQIGTNYANDFSDGVRGTDRFV
jgi:1,4-dihydroxy-2-naphthoate octaprenyltransferase